LSYVEAILYVQKPLHVIPAVLVQVTMGPPGDQQAQPMERYIDHALTLESAETLRPTGSPKRRNETPNPKVKDVTT
jgi:hypothetical protein